MSEGGDGDGDGDEEDDRSVAGESGGAGGFERGLYSRDL